MRIYAGGYANRTRLGTVYLDRRLDELELERIADALAPLNDWRDLEWIELDEHGRVVESYARPRTID